MHVLVVTFGLEGMTEAEYYRGCDEGAAAFADIPGLVGKTWIADSTSGTFGGVYTFRDRAALDAYVESELFRSIGQTPGIVNLKAEAFAVLEGPTRVTHGWTLQAA